MVRAAAAPRAPVKKTKAVKEEVAAPPPPVVDVPSAPSVDATAATAAVAPKKKRAPGISRKVKLNSDRVARKIDAGTSCPLLHATLTRVSGEMNTLHKLVGDDQMAYTTSGKGHALVNSGLEEFKEALADRIADALQTRRGKIITVSPEMISGILHSSLNNESRLAAVAGDDAVARYNAIYGAPKPKKGKKRPVYKAPPPKAPKVAAGADASGAGASAPAPKRAKTMHPSPVE